MAGWKKIVRGMIGTGLTFGAGIGGATLLVGIAAMIFGNATLDDMRFAAKMGVVGTIVGVGFSGILALSARSKRFTNISIPRFTLLGAGAGLVYFLIIAMNAYRVWTPSLAFGNFMLLILMGGGAAGATAFIARKARPQLDAGDDLPALSEGHAQLDARIRTAAETWKERV